MNNKSVKITALLPMKGHSERVPNKNIRPFAGKPLYQHVAKILQECDYVESIVINTDSERISQEAPELYSKVRIINRAESIQGDFVSMNDIIGYDLETISGDHFLQTHSTNPLLTQKTLETAVRSYFEHLDKHDSLFSVTRLQTRLYWGSGKPVNHSPQQLERTQDLPPVYEENSNLYLFSRSSFKNAGNNRIGCNPKMFSMHPLEALDIDEETDFQIAETIYHLKRSRKI